MTLYLTLKEIMVYVVFFQVIASYLSIVTDFNLPTHIWHPMGLGCVMYLAILRQAWSATDIQTET